MKKLIATTASRSTFEDSLVPIVLHLAKQLKAEQDGLKATIRENEDEAAKADELKSTEAVEYAALMLSMEKAENYKQERVSLALRKFTLAYRLAKLEHGEIAVVLALSGYGF